MTFRTRYGLHHRVKHCVIDDLDLGYSIARLPFVQAHDGICGECFGERTFDFDLARKFLMTEAEL